MRHALLAGWLAFVCVPGDALAQTADSGGIRGIVLDRADGSPITDVSVRIQDTKLEVKTDAVGRFELQGVAAGRQTVYVSTVGFILVKRPVQITAGETLDLTIVLSEGTGTYSETVTVTAEGGKFPEQESRSRRSRRSVAPTSELRNL